MEIEKTRETSWKIHLGNKNNFIELSSIEVGGEVRKIRLSLKNNKNNTMEVEMDKDKFFNFLSLISAFKDVVIGNYEDTNFGIMDGVNENSDNFSISEDLNQNEEKIKENEKNVMDEEKSSDDTKWDLW
ncbi:MAG: hypothetical protein R6U96_11975 [Promethearchaeia archaeon]